MCAARKVKRQQLVPGGGENHRMGLYDMMMIKDNHVTAAGGVAPAIARAEAYISHKVIACKVTVVAVAHTVFSCSSPVCFCATPCCSFPYVSVLCAEFFFERSAAYLLCYCSADSLWERITSNETHSLLLFGHSQWYLVPCNELSLMPGCL
jgi:hypothetical protein